MSPQPHRKPDGKGAESEAPDIPMEKFKVLARRLVGVPREEIESIAETENDAIT